MGSDVVVMFELDFQQRYTNMLEEELKGFGVSQESLDFIKQLVRDEQLVLKKARRS